MQCSDAMIHMGGIEPESCDHVFDAQYCIKSTSLDGTSFWNDNLQLYNQINVCVHCQFVVVFLKV